MGMHFNNRLFYLSLVISLLTAATTLAQTNSQSTEQQLVILNVLVTDAAKRPVSDVRQEEFRVFENGVPQTISFFSTADAPLLYGLVLDTSGDFGNNFQGVLEPVVTAAQAIVSQNSPTDETLLVRSIRNETETVKDFTTDRVELFRSLGALTSRWGGSTVIDAVYLTAQRISEYKKDDGVNRRRAIILITDGNDRRSHYKRDQLINLLRKERIRVFVIGMDLLTDWCCQRDRSPRERAMDLIDTLTK